MTDAKRRLRRALARVPWLLTFARLAVVTIRTCLKYRVTGLASEAGFFALLSLPPLVLGLFGGLGYFGGMLGPQAVSDVRDAVSVGFVLSLWSGSRAVNVFVDTISIMYGQSGVRGIVRTRALSFSLYVLGIFVGIVTVPLILLGPTLLGQFLPDSWGWLIVFYWPLVTLLTVGGLTNLYHVSTPRRSPWLRDVPGAVLTLVVWVIASFVVRGSIAASLGGTSIYGPLSAPIVLLIWLYALAIAVLIGAALNAAVREIWPVPDERALHERLIDWTREAWQRGSLRTPRSSRSPAWDDPFEGYGPAPDDLSLGSLKEAARGPLTPIPGAGGVQGSSSAEDAYSRPRADR